jgi:hypothetical protein
VLVRWTGAQGGTTMFEYHLEHIMSYTAELGEREVIAPLPEGLRINVHVSATTALFPRY